MNNQSQSTSFKRKQPRFAIVFWFFFFLAIPTIIFTLLYAAGYRWDKSANTVTRDGAISIVSTPKSANVVINGESQNEKTPFIETVPSGRYAIQVSKDGYSTWSKTLSVDDGKSIVVPDVVLFLNEPRTITATPSTSASLSVYERQIIPNTEEELAQRATEIEELGFDQKNITLYEEGPSMILVNSAISQTFIVSDLTKESFQKPIEGTLTHAQWINRTTLLYSMGGDLWVYDTKTESNDLLVRQTRPITSVGVHGNESIYYFTDNDGMYAVERDSRDTRQRWTLLQEPNSIIQEVRSNGRVVLIKDTETNDISGYELYDQNFLF